MGKYLPESFAEATRAPLTQTSACWSSSNAVTVTVPSGFLNTTACKGRTPKPDTTTSHVVRSVPMKTARAAPTSGASITWYSASELKFESDKPKRFGLRNGVSRHVPAGGWEFS